MIAKALKLFCPRAAKWIQVHFQKEKEVEQTEVSQFLPCDSESFPRSIWDGWVDTHYISSSTVLPREHLTSCHSDEDVQDQGKTHRKHGKAGFLRQTTSLLHLMESIFSAEEMLSQLHSSSTAIPDVCSYCCRGKQHRQSRERARNKPDKGWSSIHCCYSGSTGTLHRFLEV